MGNNPVNFNDPTGHEPKGPGSCYGYDSSTGGCVNLGLGANNTGSNTGGGSEGGNDSGEEDGLDLKDMTTSDDGEDFIKYWEQNPPPLYPYPDMGGNCTIGWGHVLPNDGNKCSGWPNKKYGNGITTKTAQMLFDGDIINFENLINDTITVDLTHSQFDALVSYTFNTGDQTNNPYFVKNIPELINSGNFEAAAEAIRSGPITSGGQESLKLVERRQREADLFLFGIYFP